MEQFYSEEGCPKLKPEAAKKNLFPFLDMSGLEEAERIDLEARLKSETRKIKFCFASFTSDVRRSLEHWEVPLKRIKVSLLSLEAFDDGIGVKVLDVEDAQKIEAAEDLDDLFITLHKYISFFNYYIIEYIIEQHGATKDHERLEDYKKKFETFCKRSIFEIPENVGAPYSRKTAKVLVLKCTESVSTLKGVEEVRYEVATIFGLRPSALQLCSIKRGCVELHFLLSSAVADHIFPVSPSKHSALCEIGAKVLLCKGVDQNASEEVE